MTHPVVRSLLSGLPGVVVERSVISEDGEYHHATGRIVIRHGLRGPRWVSAIVHEALHAYRDHQECCTPELEARQEASVRRDAARLLIDIRELAEAASAYPTDPHRVADELGVTYDMVTNRIQHLHPSERGYLKRRLAHTEESA